MERLSNSFSALQCDDGDDDQATTTSSSEASAPKHGSASSSTGSKVKEANNGKATVEKHNNNNSVVTSSTEFKLPIVWIDLEMTGLNVEVDRILEIACIITDGNLTKSVEGPNLVINQSKECLDQMGKWCQDNHGASGLTKMVLQSKISEREAESQIIAFLKKYIGNDIPSLAGNSVYVDLIFLKKYMPKLAEIFPHVIVDVSSVMALCFRWYPSEKKKAPAKSRKHRALDDIRESIRELKFYKDNIFKPSKSKR